MSLLVSKNCLNSFLYSMEIRKCFIEYLAASQMAQSFILKPRVAEIYKITFSDPGVVQVTDEIGPNCTKNKTEIVNRKWHSLMRFILLSNAYESVENDLTAVFNKTVHSVSEKFMDTDL